MKEFCRKIVFCIIFFFIALHSNFLYSNNTFSHLKLVLLKKTDEEVIALLGLPSKVFPSFYEKDVKIWYYEHIYEVNSLKDIYILFKDDRAKEVKQGLFKEIDP